jgi:hypothetical protein
MFKFDFDLDGANDEQDQDSAVAEVSREKTTIEHDLVSFTEVSLAQLVWRLLISCSSPIITMEKKFSYPLFHP